MSHNEEGNKWEDVWKSPAKISSQKQEKRLPINFSKLDLRLLTSLSQVLLIEAPSLKIMGKDEAKCSASSKGPWGHFNFSNKERTLVNRNNKNKVETAKEKKMGLTKCSIIHKSGLYQYTHPITLEFLVAIEE